VKHRRGCLLLMMAALLGLFVFTPCLPVRLLSRVETGLHSGDHARRLMAAIKGLPPDQLDGPDQFGNWSEASVSGLRQRALAVDGWDTIAFIEPYDDGEALSRDPRIGGWLARRQFRCETNSINDSVWRVMAFSHGAVIMNAFTHLAFSTPGSFLITRAP